MSNAYMVFGLAEASLRVALWAAIAGSKEPVHHKALKAIFKSKGVASLLYHMRLAEQIRATNYNGARCYIACSTPSGVSVELLDKISRVRATSQL